MNMGRRTLWAALLLCACQQPGEPLAGSHQGADQSDVAAQPAAPSLAPQPVTAQPASMTGATQLSPTAMRSCADELGQSAAQQLADRCRAVSPATHPPCHPDNSCALIDEEMSRGCAMLGADAASSDCQVLTTDDGRAVAVIRRYYSAINARDFATAYQQWGGDGAASGKSFAAFRDGFAATASVRVTIGSVGSIEGAAGSLYLDVPVHVQATQADGTRHMFNGTYSLRRINDVDGADPQQLLWHIASARLREAR